jgi:hypothetical protein
MPNNPTFSAIGLLCHANGRRRRHSENRIAAASTVITQPRSCSVIQSNELATETNSQADAGRSSTLARN